MREDIAEIVYAAIDELNAQSDGQTLVEKIPDAPLLGSDTGIDSLAFINLIVAIEEQIQQRTGTSLVLVDEGFMATESHPFRTVATLVEYVARVLDSKTRT